MHRFSSRVTPLVALATAMSMAWMLASAPRFENGRDLDSVIRKTRSGPQRDTGDAVDHHFEIADTVVVGISDAHTTEHRLSVHAPPGAAMLPPGPATLPGPDTRFSLLFFPPVSSIPLARPCPPALGRAPPTA